jgi:hypothetical protein
MVMTAIAEDYWQEQADDPEVRIDGRIQPGLEDAYWQSAYWAEPYFRSDCGYEDYAPAYCVGYVGHAQYGGDFDDAEKSLCANWIRIKGDSRLSLDEAMQAIRAAWDHAAHGQVESEDDQDLVDAGYVDTPAPVANQPAYAPA